MGKRKPAAEKVKIDQLYGILNWMSMVSEIGTDVLSTFEEAFKVCAEKIGISEKKFKLTDESSERFIQTVINLGIGKESSFFILTWEMHAASGTVYTIEISAPTEAALDDDVDLTDELITDISKVTDGKEYFFLSTANGEAWIEVPDEEESSEEKENGRDN